MTDHIHEEGEGHEDGDAEGQLLPGVGRCLKAKDDHAGNHYAGDDQVVEVVDRLPLDGDLVGDVDVEGALATLVLHCVPHAPSAEQHPLSILLIRSVTRKHRIVLDGQVDQLLRVGPGAELQGARLVVKGEPGDADGTRGLEDSWQRTFGCIFTFYEIPGGICSISPVL